MSERSSLRKRTFRTLLGALLAAASLSLVGITAPHADAQEEFDWGQELETCVAQQRALLALFLVDESGSLQLTDPEDQRLPAVQLGVRSLASLVESLERQTDSPIEFEVAIVGFSGIAEQRGIWFAPDDIFGSPALSEIPDRDRGQETDYVNALSQVIDVFRAKSLEFGELDPCKIMFWFTDGRFDIVQRVPGGRTTGLDEQKDWAPDYDLSRDVTGILDLGRNVICSNTEFATPGLADQLRDAGVISIVLALTRQIEEADRAFLRSIAENPASDPCGTVPGIGEYSPNDDIAGTVCDTASPVDGTSIEQDCKRDTFDPNTRAVDRTLQGDPGMDRVHVVLASEIDLSSILLQAPSGDLLAITDGLDRDVQGSGVSARLTAGRVVTLEVDFAPDSDRWIGEWMLVAVSEASIDAASAFSRVTYWGDYSPSLKLRDDQVRKGDPTTLDIFVETSAGLPVDASTFEDFTIEVTALGSSELKIENVRREGSQFVADVETSAAEIGEHEVEVTIAATTASGIQLEPVTRKAEFTVAAPPGYPQLLDFEVRLDELEGTGSVPFDLRVQGAEETDGCAWINGFTLAEETLRLGAGLVTIDGVASGGDCVSVPAGEIETLTGSIVINENLRGTVSSAIDVSLQARDDMPILPASATVSLAVEKPIDGEVRTRWVIILTALGLLVPLIVSVLASWLTSRYRIGGRIKHLTTPVRVGAAGVLNENGIGSVAIKRNEMVQGPNDIDRDRSFSLGSVHFTTAKSMNPLAPARGTAAVVSGVIVSSAGTSSGRADPKRAGADLAVPNQWFLVIPAPGSRADALEAFAKDQLRGELTIVVPVEDGQETERLAEQAHNDAPDLVRSSLELLPEEAEPLETPARPAEPVAVGFGGPTAEIDVRDSTQSFATGTSQPSPEPAAPQQSTTGPTTAPTPNRRDESGDPWQQPKDNNPWT